MNKLLFGSATVMALSITAALAQVNPDEIDVTRDHLRGPVHVIFGAGGNIGVSAGEDGVFLIDDQFAPLTDKILAVIREASDGPIRFVLNTHWHFDHTGGNENFGKAGAVILAHDNVRHRLLTDQRIESLGRDVPAAPPSALPVVTFNDQSGLHLNGEQARAHHIAHAHTDGDSLIHFETSNVIHMGDLFFNGQYPFIDTSSGGNVDGVIAAAEKALDLSDADTIIIPGHGPIADRTDLETYLNVVRTSRDNVAALVERGMSLEQIVAATPTAEFDEEWGQGFRKPPAFIESIYVSLTE